VTPGRKWARDSRGRVVRAPERPAASTSDGSGLSDQSDQSDQSDRHRKAALKLALRLGFRDTYDHLGTVVLMSVAWALISAAGFFGAQSAAFRLFIGLPGQLPALLSLLGGLAGVALTAGPFTAGTFRYARNAAARREPEIFDLGWGFRSALASSVALSAVQLAGAVLLGANALFYVIQRHPLGLVVGAFFGYALAFWLLTCLYQWPLLVGQSGTERPAPMPTVLKKSALLVLDNFAFTLALGAVVLVLTAALWAAVVPACVLWAGTLAVVLTQAIRELLRKYELLPPDPTLDPMSGEVE